MTPARLVKISAAILGIIPVLIFFFAIGRTPSLTPGEAQAKLAQGSVFVLVDVRPGDEFGSQHLPQAVNFPYSKIERLASASEVPAELRDKTLLMLCQSGILSALAAQKLTNLGLHAVNIDGGMQRWVKDAAASSCALGSGSEALKKSGEPACVPCAKAWRDSSGLEQFAAVFSGFTLKPIYMLAALVLAWVLRKRRETDLVSLRGCLLVFFLGEFFCALNYVCADSSALLEYLHSYGMVAAIGLGVFALIEALDQRVLGLSDPKRKCAALNLCRQCIKHTAAPCGLTRIFQIIIPALSIAALLPFCAELVPVSYNTEIYGTVYNYSHPVVHQIYEIRCCPLAAALLLMVSWVILFSKKSNALHASKLFFSAALGFLLFGYLRLILFAPFRGNLVWFGFWEEVTEFLGVVAIALILWIFKRGLFTEDAQN